MAGTCSTVFVPPYPVPERLGFVNSTLPCRFEYVSSTQCRLVAWGGSGYIRNPLTGVIRDITTAPTLAIGSLSNTTLYRVFFDTSDGSLYAETSVEATTNGTRHKSGNTSRLTVGALYTSGSAFADSDTVKGVVSLYNAFPSLAEAIGQDQSNLAADDTWKVPTNAMPIVYVKHPWYPVRLWAQINLYHDSATEETRAAIDVASTGATSHWSPANRPTGSTSHTTQHYPRGYSPAAGTFSVETSRIICWGDDGGGTDTFDIIKATANRLWAEVYR